MTSPLETLHRLADAIAASPDPLARRFASALREGRPLAEFGLEYGPWLRGWLRPLAVERRNRAIVELGERLASDRVNQHLAELLRPDAKPLSDPANEALRAEALAAQEIVWTDGPTPISKETIRKVREVRQLYVGELWRTEAARHSPSVRKKVPTIEQREDATDVGIQRNADLGPHKAPTKRTARKVHRAS